MEACERMLVAAEVLVAEVLGVAAGDFETDAHRN